MWDPWIYNAFLFQKVSCVLTNENSEATNNIELKDAKRKVFQRGGIDSFILPLEK